MIEAGWAAVLDVGRLHDDRAALGVGVGLVAVGRLVEQGAREDRAVPGATSQATNWGATSLFGFTIDSTRCFCGSSLCPSWKGPAPRPPRPSTWWHR